MPIDKMRNDFKGDQMASFFFVCSESKRARGGTHKAARLAE